MTFEYPFLLFQLLMIRMMNFFDFTRCHYHTYLSKSTFFQLFIYRWELIMHTARVVRTVNALISSTPSIFKYHSLKPCRTLNVSVTRYSYFTTQTRAASTQSLSEQVYFFSINNMILLS